MSDKSALAKQAEAMTEKMTTAIRLSFPVINLITFESARASEFVRKTTEATGKFYAEMPFKSIPNGPTLEQMFQGAKKDGKEKAGMVVFDAYFFERAKLNPEATPALKSALETMEQNGINYVIAGRDSLSEEFVYHVQMPAMSEDEISALLKTCEEIVQKDKPLFTDEERSVIANNARGLSYTQMKNVFIYCAYLKFKGKEYLPEIRAEKSHILRDVGLDVLSPIDLAAVGGLENLKEFLATRKAGWDADLPAKGILLAGVPGGGKTLTAKAVAGVLGTSLVRLDMGRFYSRYLGDTEKMFSRALQTVEEISPVVLLIDEIEKFFGQSEGEHEVSRRLLGNFLYWLQERQNKVFVVATANQVNLLPPELMRAGRWDRTFFFDLPNKAERRKIFEIHLLKYTPSLEGFFMDALVQKSEGYTGAEIEQAVIDARYLANAAGEALANQHILTAITAISPTSETRKDDINRIRQLGSQGFYPANQADGEEPTGGGRRVAVS